ncbi:MAG: universal stress protein [Planctomycetota bacterium]
MIQEPSSISEILVPTDFSECSGRALQFATRIAESSDARLHLLSICDDPVLMAPTTHQSFRDERIASLSERLAEVIDSGISERFRHVSEVRVGTAYYEIETYAEQTGIDVIVMGTIGRSPLADLLLGSVASHVIRYACCPVLTVK